MRTVRVHGLGAGGGAAPLTAVRLGRPRGGVALWLLTAAIPGCFVSKGEVADWVPAAGDSPDDSPDDGASPAGDGGEDGAADGADGVSANRPPSMPDIGLVSRLPLTTDDLVVQILTEAVDPDGDAVSYQYRWSQDGTLRPELSGAVVPAAETARGEVWEVEVIASDGVADAAGVRSSATVQNSAPAASAMLRLN